MRHIAVTEFAPNGRYRYVHYPAGMFARFVAEWEERGFAELYDLGQTRGSRRTWPRCRGTAPRWRSCASS